MTIADVVTAARRLLSDTTVPYRYDTDELTSYAFQAERDAITALPSEAYPKLWVSTKRHLVNGVETYTIPSDMWRLSGVLAFNTTDLSAADPVRIVPQEEENLLYGNTNFAPSTTFRVGLFKDNIFYLKPLPTATIQNGLEFDYIQSIPDGASSAALLVGESVGDAMAWYVAALALEYEDPERAERYRAEYARKIGQEGVRYAASATGVRR